MTQWIIGTGGMPVILERKPCMQSNWYGIASSVASPTSGHAFQITKLEEDKLAPAPYTMSSGESYRKLGVVAIVAVAAIVSLWMLHAGKPEHLRVIAPVWALASILIAASMLGRGVSSSCSYDEGDWCGTKPRPHGPWPWTVGGSDPMPA